MMLRAAIIGNARKLGLFVSISTALVFAMFILTRHQISANQREVMIAKLETVLAAVHYDNNLLGQVAHLNNAEATGVSAPMPYYLARHGTTIVALVFTVVAPDGYAGPIKMLIGIRPSGEVLAVRVIEHQETPGLGDGIEIKKSAWINQFDHQSLAETASGEWKVKKDGGRFDQLTGATITPRAVVKAIRTLLLYYRTHKLQLLASPDKQQEIKHAGL